MAITGYYNILIDIAGRDLYTIPLHRYTWFRSLPLRDHWTPIMGVADVVAGWSSKDTTDYKGDILA